MKCCKCETSEASGRRLAVSEPNGKTEQPLMPAWVGNFCEKCWKWALENYNQFDALDEKP